MTGELKCWMCLLINRRKYNKIKSLIILSLKNILCIIQFLKILSWPSFEALASGWLVPFLERPIKPIPNLFLIRFSIYTQLNQPKPGTRHLGIANLRPRNWDIIIQVANTHPTCNPCTTTYSSSLLLPCCLV